MELVLCHDCQKFHKLPADPHQALASAHGFAERHPGHKIGWAPKIDGNPALPNTSSLNDWRGNADVKAALQALQTMTVTNLHSLASSATAGWQSAEVDNTSNLFLDALVQCVLDFANSAPANSKGVFVYAAGGLETGKLSNPFSGSEGTLTLTDVATTGQNAKRIGFIHYNTADEVVESSPMSVANGFGWLPPFWAIGLMNHSGAALAASGNTVKYRGIYATVI